MEHKLRLQTSRESPANLDTYTFNVSPQFFEPEITANFNSPTKQAQNTLYTKEELNTMKEEVKKNPFNPSAQIIAREIKRNSAQQSGFTDRSSQRATKREKNEENNNEEKGLEVKLQKSERIPSFSSERKALGVQKFRSEKKQMQEDSLEFKSFKGLGYKLVVKKSISSSRKDSTQQKSYESKQFIGYSFHRLSEEVKKNQHRGSESISPSTSMRQKAAVSVHSVEKKQGSEQLNKTSSVYFQGQLNQSSNNSSSYMNSKFNKLQKDSGFLSEDTPFQSKVYNKIAVQSCTLLDLKQQIQLQEKETVSQELQQQSKKEKAFKFNKIIQQSTDGNANGIEKANLSISDIASGKRVVVGGGGGGDKERRILSSFISDKNLNTLVNNRRFELEAKGELKRQLDFLQKSEIVNKKVREKFSQQIPNETQDQAQRRTKQQLSTLLHQQQEQIKKSQGISINVFQTQASSLNQSIQLTLPSFTPQDSVSLRSKYKILKSNSSSQSSSPRRIAKDLREKTPMRIGERKNQIQTSSLYANQVANQSLMNQNSQNEMSLDLQFYSLHRRGQSDLNGAQGSQKVNLQMQKIFNSRNTLIPSGALNTLQKIYTPLVVQSRDKNQNENNEIKEINFLKISPNLSSTPISPIKLRQEPSSQFGSSVQIPSKSKFVESRKLESFSQETLKRGGSPTLKLQSNNQKESQEYKKQGDETNHETRILENKVSPSSKILTNLFQGNEIQKFLYPNDEHRSKDLTKEQENLYLEKFQYLVTNEKITNVNIKKERRKQLGVSHKIPKKIADGWCSRKFKVKINPQKMQSIRLSLQKLLKKIGRLKLSIFEVFDGKIFPQKPYEKPGSYQFLSACKSGRADQIESMIQKNPHYVHEFNELLQTGLHIAAYNNRFDACLILLKLGADPNSKDCAHQTPLYYAVKNNNHLLVRAIPWSQPNLNFYNLKMDDEMRAIFNLSRVVNFLIHLHFKFNEKIWEVFMVNFDDYQHNEEGVSSNVSIEESMEKMERRY